MKIVHSLWTKPMFNTRCGHLSTLSKGGWSDRKLWFMSQALSCLQFRKFYDNVELVTDKVGYEILIKKMALPYTNVRVALDKLNGYHSDVWALAKIESFRLQDEPFIHADGDFFIFDRFPEFIHRARLSGQNAEIGHDYYELPFKKLQAVFNYIPEELTRSIKKNGEIRSMNAGIIGGSDLDFFKEFSEKAFLFVDRNYERIPDIQTSLFNIYFEQFLFYALSEAKEIPVEYLFNNVNSEFDGLTDFPQIPAKRKYMHTVGKSKRRTYIGNHIEKRLLLDYPQYYLNINNLVSNNKI